MAIFFTSACSNNATFQAYSREGFTLGTILSITIYSKEKVKDEVFTEIFEKIDEIEKKMTINAQVNSEVEQINAAAGKDFVRVSDETYNLIKESVNFTKSTEGTFDLTVGSLVKLWNIGFDDAKVPAVADIQQSLELIGVDDVTLNETDKSIKLERAGMMIDLGGIAKGYAADVAAQMLIDQGYKSALINLSSSIWCVGKKPDGKLFKVGIRDPEGAQASYIGVVSVEDNTVDTSGTYERFFEDKGITYHHILDPATGYPAENDLYSVTILTPNCTTADALSTGIFIMGLEKGYEYIEQLEGVEAIFVTRDKEIYLTEGAKDMFKLTAKGYKIVETRP